MCLLRPAPDPLAPYPCLPGRSASAAPPFPFIKRARDVWPLEWQGILQKLGRSLHLRLKLKAHIIALLSRFPGGSYKFVRPCLIGECHGDRVVIRAGRRCCLRWNSAKDGKRLGEARAGARDCIGPNAIAEGKASRRVAV